MRRCVVSLLIVVCLVGASVGEVVVFNNANGNRQWTDPGNWDMGTLLNPLPDQNANWVVLATTDGPIISDGMAAEATSIRVGFGFGIGNMQMTGGTLDMNDWLMVGTDAPDGVGTFDMSGGVITTTAPFWVGFVAEGHATMSGGIINASDFSMNVTDQPVGVGAALSTMTMTGGTMILNSDITVKLQGYADSGMLIGASWDFDISNPGKTTVTPEPATLLLLTLGGVAAYRRRRVQ